MSPGGGHHVRHHVASASRRFRLRIWLSSAMSLPVLAANVVAVALPVVDAHRGDQRSLPITTSAAQAIFGALAGGMITFTGIGSGRARRRQPTRNRFPRRYRTSRVACPGPAGLGFGRGVDPSTKETSCGCC
jgi:hypothetical protein